MGYRQETFAEKLAGMAALLSPKAFAMTNEEYANMSAYLDDYYLQSVEASNESIEYYESTMMLFVNLIDTTLITIINSKHRHFSHISQ